MNIRRKLRSRRDATLLLGLLGLLALAALLSATLTFTQSPPAQASSATLTATVDTADQTVDLAIANHTGNWWFKINWWGTCTAVTGSSITGIGGYHVGTQHSVWAYSDSGCNTQIASTTFTITPHNAGLAAHVQSDRSVNLTISNWSNSWWFRIGGGTCTATSGTTVTGIRGYQTGTYAVGAFSKSDCSGFLDDANFTIPPPTASLATTVNPGPSVNLILSNGPGNWWFKINWWGTCTAASGTAVNNIQGYTAGTHPVTAYSDSGCNTQIAASSFTIPDVSLAIAVDASDRSVDLTLTGGPTNWWFKIGWWGTCTAASGTTFDNIRGYQSGSYIVAVYPAAGCAHGSHITAESFTIPTATLSTAVNDDRTVNLTLANGTTNWWFRINSWGTCTAAPANTVSNIGGYQTGTHPVSAYSDSGCKFHIASSSFTLLPPSLTASNITSTGATLTIAEHPGAWSYKYTVPSLPTGACSDVASGTTTATLTTLSAGTEYTYQAYSGAGCAVGSELASETFTTDASLRVSAITRTSATLTLTHAAHESNWSVSQTGAGTAVCADKTSATHDLSSLTAGTEYTYQAYSGTGCITGNEIASETFTTLQGVTVSNTSETGSGVLNIGVSGGIKYQLGQAFTTGSNAGGYTLSSIAGSFSAGIGDPGFQVKLHEVSGSTPGTEITTATFSGSNPTTNGEHAFTCSGTGCALDASTTYFVTFSAPSATGSNRYLLNGTTSDSETLTPASNGWSIANAVTEQQGAGSWYVHGASHAAKIKVTAETKSTAPAFLTASDIATTSATLTLANHTGDWWLKQTAPNSGTCTAGEADFSHALSSLTAGTWYTYKAYSDSTCTAANEIASKSFGTPLTVSNLNETSLGTSLRVEHNAAKAQEFTTGSWAAGYTLRSVTVDSVLQYHNSQITMTIRARQSDGTPASTPLATLSTSHSGVVPTGNVTYTCSGSGCALAANTQYFVYLSTSSQTPIAGLDLTGSTAETLVPSNNGWSIADVARDQGLSWGDLTDGTLRMKVTATPR